MHHTAIITQILQPKTKFTL